jgi:hypothetical protein
MKCPSCEHVSETALLKCGECGEVYDRHTLEEFQHVSYLLDWLAEQDVTIDQGTLRRLQESAEARRDVLHDILFPPVTTVLEETEKRNIVMALSVINQIPDWILKESIELGSSVKLRDYLQERVNKIHPDPDSLELPEISSEERKRYIQANIHEWQNAGLIMEAEKTAILGHLSPRKEKPQPDVVVPQEVIAPQAVAAPQKTQSIQQSVPVRKPEPPKAPPKPREPLIRWDKIWSNIVEAAVSGLLLRWLRYLGAFLFVVSISIVVINFWNEIPQWGQVSIIFFVPLAFYAGGWVLRSRLKIVQTGGVLMGVGQILLAVDFAAIYQFGDLQIPITTYWLITSIICTILYLFTVWRLVQDEFFGYIGLVGISSTVAALTMLLTTTIEWPLG